MITRRNRMEPFFKRPVAHRGLHDNNGDAPENTLAAFRLAVEKGYGIELDIQQSRDGKLVVVHDGDLKRVAGVDRKIYEMTYEELQRYPICRSKETVPLFEDVLKLVDGRVPLIVEVKSDGDYIGTCVRMAEMMDSYKGVYCMESFHPRAVNWFRKNRPEVIRGQLSEDYNAEKEPGCRLANALMSRMIFNFITKPDFVAYDHKYYALPVLKRLRKGGKCVMVAWTIKNQKEYDEAKKHFDVIIFDSFVPHEV